MKDASLKLRHLGENCWVFEYPESSFGLNERLQDAIEWMQVEEYDEAEKTFRSILKEFPEHIDAYHHLAMVLDEQPGRELEAFKLWEKAVNIGLQCIPDEFQMGIDRLEWSMLENRPFLRVYHALGLEYLDRGDVKRALSIFNNLLSLNPNDNQGIRVLAIDCNFALNRPEEVLKICDNFPDDAMADTIYGRPLAQLKLGNAQDAERALLEAVEFKPLVAKELVKTKHRRPKDMWDDRLTVGGPDEAYDYYLRVSKHWKKTEGALDLVRKCLQESDKED